MLLKNIDQRSRKIDISFINSNYTNDSSRILSSVILKLQFSKLWELLSVLAKFNPGPEKIMKTSKNEAVFFVRARTNLLKLEQNYLTIFASAQLLTTNIL